MVQSPLLTSSNVDLDFGILVSVLVFRQTGSMERELAKEIAPSLRGSSFWVSLSEIPVRGRRIETKEFSRHVFRLGTPMVLFSFAQM